MPELFSANGSHDPFLSDEERRRMTEENRAHAVQNTPRSITDAHYDDAADRLARYQRSASNLRAATMGESYEDAHAVHSRPLPDDAGYPRGPKGGFSYFAGANAYAPWQEDDEPETESNDAEPVYEAEALPEAVPADDDGRRIIHSGRYATVINAQARRFSDLLRNGLRRTPVAAIRVFFLAVCALALLGGTIYGKVKTNEIYTDLAVKQAEYDDLKASNVSLRSEIDGKTTVKNVEEYAEDVLGLMQLDDSQIKYIKIQTEDQVMIAEPEQTFWEKLQENFRAVWAWLRGA